MWHHFKKGEALRAFVVAAAAAVAVAGCAENNDTASANADAVVGVTMDSNGRMYVVERKSGALRVCSYKYETVELVWCKNLPPAP